MKEYKKPLVEVFELRVTENIAVSASAKAKWDKAWGAITEYNLLAGEGSIGA